MARNLQALHLQLSVLHKLLLLLEPLLLLQVLLVGTHLQSLLLLLLLLLRAYEAGAASFLAACLPSWKPFLKRRGRSLM